MLLGLTNKQTNKQTNNNNNNNNNNSSRRNLRNQIISPTLVCDTSLSYIRAILPLSTRLSYVCVCVSISL